MSFRRDLYERVMHQKDFGKVKNKIYDILGWFVDYSMSAVIAMEFPIEKGFFETIADTHLIEVKECKQIDFESMGNSNMKCDGRLCKLKEIYSTEEQQKKWVEDCEATIGQCPYYTPKIEQKSADYYEGFNDAAQLIMATLKVVNGIKQQINNWE